ncbi:helix-turn-helix domain-containing protein [Lysobacter soli]|uniref:helix-turn-helix domain-containing protein n=1 Tax=Lysobacter soli TaxID=453783 RepID=UPI0037C7C4C5
MKGPDPLTVFGDAVRQARQRLGVSQEEMAAILGMHRTQLGHIEQGRKDCRLSTVMRLADALQLPLSSLLKPLDQLT